MSAMTRIVFILAVAVFAALDGVVWADPAIATTDEIASLEGGNAPKAVNDPNEAAVGSGWWWLQIILPTIPVVVLAFLTGGYVWHTRTIALATLEQARLMVNPAIVAEPIPWRIETESPEKMVVDVGVVNSGNALAFGLLLDGEIVLAARGRMRQETVLAREEPHGVARTLRPDSAVPQSEKPRLVFGKVCVERLLDECREAEPAQDEGHGQLLRSRIKIIVYYWNNLGQHYACRCESAITLFKAIVDGGDEKYSLRGFRSVITHSTISKKQMDKEIAARNQKRHVNN